MENTGETGGGVANKEKAGRAAWPGGSALRPLGTLDTVLASSASLEVKAACIELAIVAKGRRGG